MPGACGFYLLTTHLDLSQTTVYLTVSLTLDHTKSVFHTHTHPFSFISRDMSVVGWSLFTASLWVFHSDVLPPPVLGGQWPTHTLGVWHSLKPGCAWLTGGSLELDSIIEEIISLWGHLSIYYSAEILYWSRKEILHALAPQTSERRVSYTAATLEVVEIWLFAHTQTYSDCTITYLYICAPSVSIKYSGTSYMKLHSLAYTHLLNTT